MTNYAEILVVDDMPDHIAYSGTLLRAGVLYSELLPCI